MKPFALIFGLLLILGSCSTAPDTPKEADENSFSFVFMTDIHLKPEMRAPEGFQMAIDKVNELAPDFVVTGGDLIDDALWASYGRADTLFNMYAEMIEGFNMPVYNTMGNHDFYGFSSTPAVDPGDPDYGAGMYEERFGKRYYSFDHNGWHFMVIDGIEKGEGNYGSYIGKVDEEQLNWIREDLTKVDSLTPIVLVCHIPIVSIFPQIKNGPLNTDIKSQIVTNQTEVLAPFRTKNLKLVLQGHEHAIEELTLMDQVTFITGGAVSGQWWRTPDDGLLQEGFLKIDVKGDDFSWEYVDYGWETGITMESN